ncbi:MAG: hypothetical protein MK108_07395 [Mariniblastus sp.]|nr:hypothetical protein [Mariniblastus sp.]
MKKSMFLLLLTVCVFSLAGGPFLSAQQGESTDWYKGNLHTHSLWSDGNDFPEMISKWYADRGYHFLALTDHNILSRGQKWMPLTTIESRAGKEALGKYQSAFGEFVEQRTTDEGNVEIRLQPLARYRGELEKPGEFLLMEGEEISDSVDGLPVHMNATNLTDLLRPVGGTTVREAIANNLRAAMEQSRKTGRQTLIHLNHPNFGWAVTAEDMAFVTEERFFEVYNGHPGVNQLGDANHPAIERMWDIANTLRLDRLKQPPLFGLGTDDSHHYHESTGSTPGRGWVMVRATALNPDAILSAINAGDFYASSGVTLRQVDFDEAEGTLQVEVEPEASHEYTIEFVGTLKDYDRTSQVRRDANENELRATRIYSPDIGKVLQRVEGPRAVYRLTGQELFVRAVITSSAGHDNPSFKGQKKQAWTQPVGWSVPGK